MNNKRLDEEVKKLAEYQKKQAIELEIEQLKGELNVKKHMRSDGDAEIVKEVEKIYKGLTEKEEELADRDKFNQTLLLRERRTNSVCATSLVSLTVNLVIVIVAVTILLLGKY
ncbi:hypothetical protein YC2023_075966 [Brassica napus]